MGFTTKEVVMVAFIATSQFIVGALIGGALMYILKPVVDVLIGKLIGAAKKA